RGCRRHLYQRAELKLAITGAALEEPAGKLESRYGDAADLALCCRAGITRRRLHPLASVHDRSSAVPPRLGGKSLRNSFRGAGVAADQPKMRGKSQGRPSMLFILSLSKDAQAERPL